MKGIKYWFAIAMLLSFFSIARTVTAGDLDEGISTYTDDSVSKDDETFKREKNIKYIMQKAQSAAGKSKDGKSQDGKSQDGCNVGGVNVGAGATVKGDIYNVNTGKGDTTVVCQ